MLNKEDIMALAWEHSEASGKRYTFTEESLFEFLKELEKKPAPAQDEREAPAVEEPTIVAYGDPKAFKNLRIDGHKSAPYNHEWMWAAAAPGLVPMIELDQHKRIVAALTRPSQKYDDVLLPFLSMMRAELHANAGKGDRPGWLAMDVKTVLLEIFYHIGKLQKAAKKGDRDGIREYSADVANMSMMLADICGVLPGYQAQTAPQPEQSGLVEALKRIQCLMADREAQALGGSQDRQLFVTILNIADAALSPSIPATYSCDYAGCSSKAHPGTSLCLAHHSPKNRAALSAQETNKM